MEFLFDEQFWAEQNTFQLLFCCEDCVHFSAQEETCSLLYPNEFHKKAYSFQKKDTYHLDQKARLKFCKYFEIT